jgi:hypothetical protein
MTRRILRNLSRIRTAVTHVLFAIFRTFAYKVCSAFAEIKDLYLWINYSGEQENSAYETANNCEGLKAIVRPSRRKGHYSRGYGNSMN